LRAGLSGNDFTGHEVGARRRLARTGHAVNQCRGAEGELWQPRFFDRALRAVKEYSEKVECIHLNPVRAGLVSRPEDWRWSSYNEYAGMSADEQTGRCGLIVDRVRMPSDPRTNLIAPSRGRKDADHKSGLWPCLLKPCGRQAEGYGPQGGGPRYRLNRLQAILGAAKNLVPRSKSRGSAAPFFWRGRHRLPADLVWVQERRGAVQDLPAKDDHNDILTDMSPPLRPQSNSDETTYAENRTPSLNAVGTETRCLTCKQRSRHRG
jgi:hypothetical protein